MPFLSTYAIELIRYSARLTVSKERQEIEKRLDREEIEMFGFPFNDI